MTIESILHTKIFEAVNDDYRDRAYKAIIDGQKIYPIGKPIILTRHGKVRGVSEVYEIHILSEHTIVFYEELTVFGADDSRILTKALACNPQKCRPVPEERHRTAPGASGMSPALAHAMGVDETPRSMANDDTDDGDDMDFYTFMQNL